MKDLYRILGVSESADADAVKKAYRKLAKQYHPDVTGGDKKKTERFKEINEAYAILGDEQKRREYDRLRHAPMRADGVPEGFDPDQFAQVFGGGWRGGPAGERTPGGGGVGAGPELGGDLGDLFASLFGVASNPWSRARARARGADVAGTLELTFREAALGARRNLRSGSGASIEVNVPPGIETGGRLRVPGQGAPAPRGGSPGDLHLQIVVTPDPVLRRSGDDVELDLPLSFAEAALGTQVDVPTVEGNVRVTIPPGTSSGAKLRLRGRGIKRSDGARGDQICHVQVVVPRLKPEDTEVRKLVEELDRRTRGRPVRSF